LRNETIDIIRNRDNEKDRSAHKLSTKGEETGTKTIGDQESGGKQHRWARQTTAWKSLPVGGREATSFGIGRKKIVARRFGKEGGRRRQKSFYIVIAERPMKESQIIRGGGEARRVRPRDLLGPTWSSACQKGVWWGGGGGVDGVLVIMGDAIYVSYRAQVGGGLGRPLKR